MSFRRMMLATLGAYVQGLIDAFKIRVAAAYGIFEAEACLKTQLDAVNDINLLQDATIVITPNGYNEDILHTVKGNTITATPYNLQNFTEITTGGNANLTLTSSLQTDPFGNSKLVNLIAETAVNNSHRQAYSSVTVLLGKTYTISVYLKKGNGATAPDIVQLVIPNLSSSYANFDINSGLVTLTSGCTAAINNTGLSSGWWRCSITLTTVATSTIAQLNIILVNNNPLASYIPSYLGATTSNLFFTGVQFEEGLVATTYQPVAFTRILEQGYAQHTRSTTGYRVESTGLVREVPQENLLAASENMLLSTVTKTNLTVVANTEPSPIANAIPMLLNDGAVATVGRRRIANVTTPLISIGEEYMLSIYAKKAQHDWIQVSPVNANYNTDDWANFNLSTGTIGNKGATGTAYIESIGNGWYRCSVLCRAVGNVTQQIDVCQSIGNVNGGRYPSLAGTNQNVFYICGNTFTRGNTVKPYYPTIGRINTPRIDYTDGSCPTLLLEAAVSNQLIRSEEFDNASWIKSNLTATQNTEVAPNGLLTADTLLATSNNAYISTNAASVATVRKVFSVYLKRKTGVGNIILEIGEYTSTVLINSSTWTRCYVISDIPPASNYTIVSGLHTVTTPYPHNLETGDFIRFNRVTGGAVNVNSTITVTSPTEFTFSFGALTTSGTCAIYVHTMRIKFQTSGDEVYAWGAQFENTATVLQNGYYEPTSYIPTTTSSVTRSSDLLNIYKIRENNILNNQFSLFWECKKIGGGSSQNYHISLTDTTIPGSTNPNGVLISGLPLLIRRNDNSVALTNTPTYQPLSTNYYKGLITCNNGTFNVWIDGSLLFSFTMTNYDKLTLLSLTGDANGITRFKHIYGWNRVLNRAEIDSLFEYPYFNAGYTPVNNELQQIINRANAEGFTIPSTTILGYCDTLITEMKNDGVWNVSDVYYNFAYNDVLLSNFARINWRNPYGGLGLALVTAGVTSTIGGFKTTPTTPVNLSFNPSLAVYNYSADNAGRMFVIRTDATTGFYYDGDVGGGSNNRLYSLGSTATEIKINSSNAFSVSNITVNGTGLKSLMRDSSNSVRFQNKTVLHTSTQARTGLPTNSQSISLFSNGCDAEYSNYWMGASISNAQINNFRTYYNTYLTNIGLTAYA